MIRESEMSDGRREVGDALAETHHKKEMSESNELVEFEQRRDE